MKKLFLFLSLIALTSVADAQIKGILDRAKQRAKDKANQKINTTADNAVDSAFSKTERKAGDVIKGNTDSTKKKEKTKKSKDGAENNQMGNENTTAPTMTVYKKFDFVPGDKILLLEDFNKVATGDFPDKWNTNSTGEIVTIDGMEGKWLLLQKDGVFIPETITSLPENFTFQFELICNKEFSFYSSAFFFDIAALKTQKNYTEWKQYSTAGRNGLEILFHPMNAGFTAGSTEYNYYENGSVTLKNQTNTKQFHATSNNHVKISIWRQKQRIRVYMNEEKVWDVPKALDAAMKYNSIVFALGASANASDHYYLGNIKLAVGAPDIRNRLMTEGKFTTRGILFDVNSDVIKPQSYGTLKDIANMLKENAGLKVRIVGHTDSDGDAQSNLDLSKRRAEAVKTILMSEFNIEESRMQTDGKGETQPVDKNLTAEGKANNRRVEFIKM